MKYILLIRLLIAVALGALVGFEREWAKKPAGLRTHILVSTGACLFTITSIHYFQMDPARIASHIVEGVGFIGAGTIIATKAKVKGITTAASLWAVAAIGLSIGAGSYLLGFFTAFLIFIVLQLGKVEKGLEDLETNHSKPEK